LPALGQVFFLFGLSNLNGRLFTATTTIVSVNRLFKTLEAL
jgi:hypothetical protein